jgi:glycosyltransferase involved in cell wall biosynthesis
VLRIGYGCHDWFPSTAAHAQQIVWTLVEVARLGVSVTLLVAGVREDRHGNGRETLAGWYGVPSGRLPDGLTIEARSVVAWPKWVAHPVFDAASSSYFASRPVDLIWTRNLGIATWCTRAGLPTVFETYRPDIASDRRFAFWRQVTLRSRFLRGVILHSQAAADAFLRAGVPERRCLVARNGYASALMEPRLRTREARLQLGLDLGRPLMVYAGRVHRRKGMEALRRLASAVPEAQLLIVGTEADTETHRFEREVEASGIRNILLRPRVRPVDVAPYLYAADCLVIPPPLEPRFGWRTVLPLKVFTYLAAGRAILAPRLPEFEEVLNDGETARLVPPDDTDAAARGVRELLTDAVLRERLARNALEAAASYTWETRARRIVDFLETLH